MISKEIKLLLKNFPVINCMDYIPYFLTNLKSIFHIKIGKQMEMVSFFFNFKIHKNRIIVNLTVNISLRNIFNKKKVYV